MTTSIEKYGNFLCRALAGVAIGAPMLLVCAVSQLPEGTQRGEFMVYGLGAVLAVLVSALVLRAMYTMGFRNALRMESLRPNCSLTA